MNETAPFVIFGCGFFVFPFASNKIRSYLCSTKMAIIMKSLYNENVAINAILYLLKRMNGTCDIHKVCKMLYYADQFSLAHFCRSVTGDTYIAMPYGPVPSNIEDGFKGLRGTKFYVSRDAIKNLEKAIAFQNKYCIKALSLPNEDYLSNSDIESLDYAFDKCKDLSFSQLTEMSHDLAWNESKKNGEMSIKDIMREAKCSEEYIDYVFSQEQIQLSLL